MNSITVIVTCKLLRSVLLPFPNLSWFNNHCKYRCVWTRYHGYLGIGLICTNLVNRLGAPSRLADVVKPAIPENKGILCVLLSYSLLQNTVTKKVSNSKVYLESIVMYICDIVTYFVHAKLSIHHVWNGTIPCFHLSMFSPMVGASLRFMMPSRHLWQRPKFFRRLFLNTVDFP